jgi:hypothetical protein
MIPGLHVKLAAVLGLLLLSAFSPLQSDPEAIRQHVQGYVKDQNLGDKEAILKFGTVAIPVLYEERSKLQGRTFDSLTEILFTLKFKDHKDSRSVSFRQALGTARWDANYQSYPLNVLLDRVLRIQDEKLGIINWNYDKDRYPSPDTVEYQKGYEFTNGYLEIDRAFSRFNLDWAYRYGVFLVSSPSRLWKYPDDGKRLTPEEEGRLERLATDLDAADPGIREQAVRTIPAFGRKAIAPLKRLQGSNEAKLRASAVLKLLETRYSQFFWDTDCAIDRQTLEPKDKETLDKLVEGSRALPASALFQLDRLDAVTAAISAASGIPVECSDLIADTKITLKLAGVSPHHALLLLSKMYGLDFFVRTRKILVDRKAEIEKFFR